MKSPITKTLVVGMLAMACAAIGWVAASATLNKSDEESSPPFHIVINNAAALVWSEAGTRYVVVNAAQTE